MIVFARLQSICSSCSGNIPSDSIAKSSPPQGIGQRPATSPLNMAAVCLANSIAFVPSNTAPLIVAGLILGLGFNEADSGLVLTVELLLMGIAAMGLAAYMTRVKTRDASIAGAVLLLVGHSLAATAGSLEAILVWRGIAGFGAGIVLAAVNATIAGAPNPARLYGLALMVSPLIGTVTAFIMSRMVAAFAHAGAFGVLAVLTLLVFPMLWAFPDYRTQSATPKREPLPQRVPGVVLMIGIFLFGLGMNAYFPFIERLGVRLDLSLERIGEIFTVVVVAGAVGAGTAGAIGTRFGILVPLIGSFLLHAAAMILVIEIASLPAYIIGALLEGASFSFSLTFQFSLAAMLDRYGRWAAAAGGTLSFSFGFGPYLGGLLIENLGFSALSILIIVTTIPAMAAFWWVAQTRGSPQAVVAQR